ncbi:Ketosteroid isomerase-related protein [Nonomuraea solani]|uniref:Ketosteroid isomerase-related protein n=1 Tax=Nonomuraea solani TaxID=1144553 RepID=A0A1H6BWK0_9ACTN|nr:ester cyclase [Nonomuraea solani]SEG64817.1 Ketosteroid isomerase-related protein [Nonomuraea solani]
MRAGDVHRRILELYPEVLATGRMDEALDLIDPDVIDHRGGTDGDHHGLAAWRQKWERAVSGETGFHDVSVTVEQNVCDGDLSANVYLSRGTHTASGRRYEVRGMDLIRVRDGRIVEHWAVRDAVAMRHQLGFDQ